MKIPLGSLALVGSGEYTLGMAEFERELIELGRANGKRGGYVQFATAAGKESVDRLNYWRELGKQQAERIGVECKFVPLFDKVGINNPQFRELVKDASLIYFSGGNPVHLAQTLHGTDLLKAIKDEFASGTSLAGCSAGAMAMAEEASIHWRKNKESHDGFGILPRMKIFPHYDRYFGNIPSPIRSFITKSRDEEFSIGIDENTALLWNKESWSVRGVGNIHLLGSHKNEDKNRFNNGENLNFLPTPVIN